MTGKAPKPVRATKALIEEAAFHAYQLAGALMDDLAMATGREWLERPQEELLMDLLSGIGGNVNAVKLRAFVNRAERLAKKRAPIVPKPRAGRRRKQ